MMLNERLGTPYVTADTISRYSIWVSQFIIAGWLWEFDNGYQTRTVYAGKTCQNFDDPIPWEGITNAH